jgi:prefoldin subunit 1
VLQEIGQKKAFAEQQLLIVKQQKASKTRETRILQLTSSEVESLPKDTKVYEGVGKMYDSNSTCSSLRVHILIEDRFVCTPIPDVQKRLAIEGDELKAELANLDKKEDYLEKTFQNSKNSLEQVLGGAAR